MISKDEMKKRVGEYAATLVPPDAFIGVGTGTTAYWLIVTLGRMVREGFRVRGAVPTSAATAKLATEQGITVTDLNDVDRLAVTIDGADEVDPAFSLIKGGGGAHLQEKIVAGASDRMIVIVDEEKLVPVLGKFPLPVEVIPFGWKQVERRLLGMGCPSVTLRSREGKTFVTDHGNYILDASFGRIGAPGWLGEALHEIPGVVEHGLFVGFATEVVVGYADGRVGKISRKT